MSPIEPLSSTCFPDIAVDNPQIATAYSVRLCVLPALFADCVGLGRCDLFDKHGGGLLPERPLAGRNREAYGNFPYP